MNRILGSVVLNISILGLFAAASGCGGSRVERESAVKSVSPDSLHAWMRSGRSLELFDTRARHVYEHRHIPGAVPVGERTVTQLREILPVDPSTPIVIYNQTGEVDPKTYDLAADAAENYRFPAVYWLDGGLEGWVASGYNLTGTRIQD